MALSFDSSDGGILSVDSHRVVPAPFLTKTYQLVDDPASNDIVSWGEDGSTFVVWRPPEFARDLLPNYFKHNNFSSFVRQLNTYGFRKVVPDRWEFANDFFRKGERHLLCEIHRRKAQCSLAHLQHYGSLSPSTSGDEQQQQQQHQLACSSTGGMAAAWSTSPLSSSPLHSPRGICSSSVTAAAIASASSTPMSLSDENERLRRDNCLLLSELARLQKLYDDALLFLQHSMKSSSDDHLPRLIATNSSNATANLLLMSSAAAASRQQHQLHHQLRQHHQLPPPPPPALSAQEQHQTSASNLIVAGGGLAVGNSSKSLGMDAAAPRASTIDFVDGKLRELSAAAAAGGGKPAAAKALALASSSSPAGRVDEDGDDQGRGGGPKLFGVVLHGRKRLHPDQQASPVVDHIQEMPVVKAAKIELDLMPSTAVSSSEAPWLKLRASRDDRVCI